MTEKSNCDKIYDMIKDILKRKPVKYKKDRQLNMPTGLGHDSSMMDNSNEGFEDEAGYIKEKINIDIDKLKKELTNIKNKKIIVGCRNNERGIYYGYRYDADSDEARHGTEHHNYIMYYKEKDELHYSLTRYHNMYGTSYSYHLFFEDKNP